MILFFYILTVVLFLFFVDTVYINPNKPEGHREFLVIPLSDHNQDGILHNGFGIEIPSASLMLFKNDAYKAWLRNPHEMVLQLPTASFPFLYDTTSYSRERMRLKGHSESYELGRMVVRNRIMDMEHQDRLYYNLLLVFPEEFTLTNAVFTPTQSPFGRITPQVTPHVHKFKLDQTNEITNLEVSIAFRVTIVDAEPRRSLPPTTNNQSEASLAAAVNGMGL